jgi:hypothetical protein
MPRNPMAQFLELSHELLHCIFIEVSPPDLAALSASCKSLHSYIRNNRLLHKDLYVRHYDEPSEESNWESALHEVVKLEKLLDCPNRQTKKENLGLAAAGIERLVNTANKDHTESKNIQLLDAAFHDTDNIDTLLCASSLFERAGNELQVPAETEELRQASAKLHCLYGVPIDALPSARSFTSMLLTQLTGGAGGATITLTSSSMDPSARRDSIESEPLPPSSCTRSNTRPLLTHTYARSKVYDLREYNEGTLWGPFLADGSQRPDWEKVEAIMIVLGFNLRKFADRSSGRFPRVWEDPFVGATSGSYRAPPKIEHIAPEAEEEEPEQKRVRDLAADLDSRDPYGISGSWMRVVCFLDYNDLYAFNFTERIPDGQAREPIDTEEGTIRLRECVSMHHVINFLSLAIRLIRIKLQVTRIDPPGTPEEDSEDDDDDDGEWGDEVRDRRSPEWVDWSGFKGERLPTVHFRGTSRSLHASWDPNANSKIRGEFKL